MHYKIGRKRTELCTPPPKGVFSNTETALTITISEFSRFQRYITFDKWIASFGENHIRFFPVILEYENKHLSPHLQFFAIFILSKT